jgi:hypothetical protein
VSVAVSPCLLLWWGGKVARSGEMMHGQSGPALAVAER